MSKVDNILANMRSVSKAGDYIAKGALGEQALIEVIKDYTRCNGGVMFQSVKYPYAHKHDNTIAGGNLKWEDGKIVSYETGGGRELVDECDVVLITDRRIFILEAKSYSQTTLIITPYWTFSSKKKCPENPLGAVEKCLMSQTEKHARHFYNTFWEFLPEGYPDYIVPILVSIDKSKIQNQQDEYPVAVLNNVNYVIGELDKYLKYSLNVAKIVDAMRDRCIHMGEI